MIDRLIEKIEELKNPSVVGLDPTIEMIPDVMREAAISEYGPTAQAVAEMFLRFNREIIDCIYDIVPAVKPQIAMYEKYGLHGVRAYLETTEYATSKGLLVIGDVKRGDISSTAEAYAGHLSGVEIDGVKYDLWNEDAITVNPYLGTDGILPFTEAIKDLDKMIFVLVKTSNPSSSEIQDLLAVAAGSSSGETDENADPIYVKVAKLTQMWGSELIGSYGFSKVGAVVGATHPAVGQHLRALFPQLFFLVPGYGAQGASAEDLRGFFDRHGRGCIVNSSRGIIAAWKKESIGFPVGDAARKAALQMQEELTKVL
ncbi:MAG: orotidine-5'-phosphate decarboxylase [Clostridiales Family XIII bacterium]|jgi:orotidine-5'-phosphate decarboxylase|nr:orotidine-5'-phosphate decarboxylase [Clostridiales Family XIII bacterium]